MAPSTVGTRAVAVAVAVVVAALLLLSAGRGSAQKDGCRGAEALEADCRQYVLVGIPKAAPSASCCAAVRSADLLCVCRGLTPGMERVVDVRKVCYVASVCGSPIPNGTKCGSLIIPKTC